MGAMISDYAPGPVLLCRDQKSAIDGVDAMFIVRPSSNKRWKRWKGDC
jgi:hypothetical protein